MSSPRGAAVALATGLACLAGGCSRAPRPAATSPPPATATAGERPIRAASPVKLCQHGVPAELCARCDPELVAVFKAQGDWCQEHGVPESQCRQCNPKLTFAAAAAPADWCREHAVPESQCTKCKPSLVAKYIAAGDYCREHGFPESVCPDCHPERVRAAGHEPPGSVELTAKVRLATAETAQEAGLATARLEIQRFARTTEVVGQIDYDQNRHALLSARGEALVVAAMVDVGDEVKVGQPLVALASAAVGAGQAQLAAAKARVGTARAALERERGLADKGISPRRDVELAAQELAAAQAAYDEALAALGATGAGAVGQGGRYLLRAPFAGTVVARSAVAGSSAAPGERLVEIADLSTMWAQLDVPELEAPLLRAGQKVSLSWEGMRSPPRAATVSRVGSAVDRATRTLRARVVLQNPDRALKAGLFVRARLEVEPAHDAILVPREAIQRVGSRSLVFVKKEAGLFEPITVELGAGTAKAVEVVRGLRPGLEVVTIGAFLLKTEVLKDSIGAGCCAGDE